MSLPISHHGASYRAWLKNDLSAVIEAKDLGLSTLHKQYLRSRWLDQVLRLEDDVARAINRYYALRLITVIGSLIILVLVSLKIDDQRWSMWATAMRYATIGLSLLVCISVAIEQVFSYGERWWQYERIVERLKTEGWRFLQLSGRYRHYSSHTEAFPTFANQVENLSQREVEAYITEVRERRKEREREESPVEVATTTQVEIPLLEDEQPQTMTSRATLRDRVSRHLNQRQVR